MTNIRKLPTADELVVDEAAAWITKLDRGLSADDERTLRTWLAKSEPNSREFTEQAKLWDSMEGLSRLADIFPEPAVPVAGANREPRQGWKVAASVVLVAGLALLLVADRFSSVSTIRSIESVETTPRTHFETAIGEQSVFELSDGTRLVLNTNSVVEVNYSASNRLLTLVRGEIHVRVAHDPSRPLSVIVGEKIVQAVGTEFNLEITSDQNVELVVTEGVVMIGVLDAPINQLPVGQPVVLLQPSSALVASGQEVQISTDILAEPKPIETKEIKSEEIAVRLSWRNGNLIFRGESLEEAVTEVGRYTAVEFVFLDEDAKKKRVVGMFKAGDVDGLLAALRKNFNVSYEWVGSDKILLGAE